MPSMLSGHIDKPCPFALRAIWDRGGGAGRQSAYALGCSFGAKVAGKKSGGFAVIPGPAPGPSGHQESVLDVRQATVKPKMGPFGIRGGTP
jgi:hypothetical protein